MPARTETPKDPVDSPNRAVAFALRVARVSPSGFGACQR
jgi:hypothetical protein